MNRVYAVWWWKGVMEKMIRCIQPYAFISSISWYIRHLMSCNYYNNNIVMILCATACVCACVCMCVHVCVCAHVCMCVCVCIVWICILCVYDTMCMCVVRVYAQCVYIFVCLVLWSRRRKTVWLVRLPCSFNFNPHLNFWLCLIIATLC